MDRVARHAYIRRGEAAALRGPLVGMLAGVMLFLVLGAIGEARAQQEIGYVDSQYIMEQLPEYQTVQQKLDKLEEQWRQEIQKREQRVEELRQEYRAWELLYTEEERKKKQKEITRAQREVEQLRQTYFGPDGQLYSRQKQLMRPIQERVLKAAEAVATAEGYDYVLDKSGKVLFLYARQEHNLSEQVLREMGVTEQTTSRGQ